MSLLINCKDLEAWMGQIACQYLLATLFKLDLSDFEIQMRRDARLPVPIYPKTSIYPF